ncbi:MAG: pyridoxamine 5'-phosphate oxidase family protein [Planctomycetes bacterium]|nr:pyridoxamine 5'-phosphate oxidase family protein [Planctomycetota bacterium]
MGKLYECIDERMATWLRAQHMFFVATAPLAREGHVNLSPKGLDSFTLLGAREVAYLDLTGSGAETLAHVRENGRITLMFCAFEGAPKIVRLYGQGRVVEPSAPEFASLRARFPLTGPARSIVVVALERIADSCGYGVPELRFVSERTKLVDWARREGDSGVRDYQRLHNLTSIDGLPALQIPK